MTDYHEFREEFEETRLTVSPNQLKAKIRKLLSSTDIKIGEFQRILGVNANSYLKFMNGKYKDQWNATLNGTYYSAAYFFFRESKLGKRALGKIRAHKQSALGKGAPKSPAAASAAASLLSPTTGVKGGKPALPSLADAVADDEYTWQTPGEVRKSLQDVLNSHSTSVAALAREANVPYQSFNNFMKAGGVWGGKDNQAYTKAATLVERLRIALGRPKSAKRKALEDEVSRGIVSRRTGGPNLGLDPDGKYFCTSGSYMAKDSLGRYKLVSPGYFF